MIPKMKIHMAASQAISPSTLSRRSRQAASDDDARKPRKSIVP